MVRITHFQFLNEVIKLNNENDFILELSKFNKLLRHLNENNIYCKFDYLDIENYARGLGGLAKINKTQIQFMPSNDWIRYIRLITTESPEFSEIFNNCAQQI